MVQRYTTMLSVQILSKIWGCRNHDRMVVGFTTTCASSAYQHSSCEFESCAWRSVHDTVLCDKVCQWLSTGQWFSPDIPVSSTNKTDCYDFTEILLKVVLNTISHTRSLNKKFYLCFLFFYIHVQVYMFILNCYVRNLTMVKKQYNKYGKYKYWWRKRYMIENQTYSVQSL